MLRRCESSDWLVKGWRSAGPFFVREHVGVKNFNTLRRTTDVQTTYIYVMVTPADILTQELRNAAYLWKTHSDSDCVFETLLQPAAMRCSKNGWSDQQIADCVNGVAP